MELHDKIRALIKKGRCQSLPCSSWGLAESPCAEQKKWRAALAGTSWDLAGSPLTWHSEVQGTQALGFPHVAFPLKMGLSRKVFTYPAEMGVGERHNWQVQSWKMIFSSN